MSEKKVQLHKVHESLGAKMIPFAGFIMPVRYTSDIEEHKTVRESVGVFDVSHMGEFLVEGPEALQLLQKVTSNDVSKLYDGKVQYSCLPNEQGGIVDDLLVYRFNENKYMLVVNATNIEKDWRWVNQHNSFDCSLTNVSDAYSLFAVQGPRATELLSELTPVDLEAMQYYTFTIGEIAGVKEVIISATGYTGSGGFELYVKNEDAEKLWGKIFEVGEKFGVKPIGLGARDTLRLEKGFCLYGNDIDDNTSPIEAGLGWITKFNKDFINKDAFLKQKEAGVAKKLVAFKVLERGIPRSHYRILNTDGKEIGKVTSGTMSPSMGVGIGMGYVETSFSEPGTSVLIEVRNKQLKAEIVKLPFVN